MHFRNWFIWFFSSSSDHSRKRPLIVYDGSSSHSGPLKVKKPEGSIVSIGSNNRLKPPPAANLSNPIRKLSGNTSSSPSSQRSSDTKNLKLEANTSVGTSLLSYSCTKKVIHKCSYCLCVWRYSKESVRTFIIKKKIILFLKKEKYAVHNACLCFILHRFRGHWSLRKWRTRSSVWLGPDLWPLFHTDLMGPQGPADRPLLSLSVTCGCPLP